MADAVPSRGSFRNGLAGRECEEIVDVEENVDAERTNLSNGLQSKNIENSSFAVWNKFISTQLQLKSVISSRDQLMKS